MTRTEARKTALVTGATSGIGLEIARLLAQDGCDLVVVARDHQKLAGMARDFEGQYGVSVRPQAADLSSRVLRAPSGRCWRPQASASTSS